MSRFLCIGYFDSLDFLTINMDLHPEVYVHWSKVFIKKNCISHTHNLQFLAHLVFKLLELT